MGVVSCGTTMLDQGVFENIGSVTWDTTAKTSGFTAVSGNGYFCNTTSAAFTVTLPSSPSAGDVVGLKDYANTADTNNITIDGNGSNIQGTASNYVINTEGRSVILVYVDATKGWLVTGSAKSADIQQSIKFVTATGGTVINCGNYKIHVFTGPGTFCVSCAGNASGSNKVSYMVVAGGGGGGGPSHGGAGGAGGFREGKAPAFESYTASPLVAADGLPVSASPYPITVGGGGTGASLPSNITPGVSGSNSIFSSITSAGGAYGASPDQGVGGNGGSGGGSGGTLGTPGGGTGNTPPTSPPQGNNGGASNYSSPNYGTGGGGGATSSGANGTSTAGGNGGNGAGTAITTSSCYGTPGPNGSLRYYSGGGGGSIFISGPIGTQGTGGYGGGGNGRSGPGTYTSYPGTINTGGGAGGASRGDIPGAAPNTCIAAGNGGSGIVIIRYKYQ